MKEMDERTGLQPRIIDGVVQVFASFKRNALRHERLKGLEVSMLMPSATAGTPDCRLEIERRMVKRALSSRRAKGMKDKRPIKRGVITDEHAPPSSAARDPICQLPRPIERIGAVCSKCCQVKTMDARRRGVFLGVFGRRPFSIERVAEHPLCVLALHYHDTDREQGVASREWT